VTDGADGLSKDFQVPIVFDQRYSAFGTSIGSFFDLSIVVFDLVAETCRKTFTFRAFKKGVPACLGLNRMIIENIGNMFSSPIWNVFDDVKQIVVLTAVTE
jgi:hypothetical protein